MSRLPLGKLTSLILSYGYQIWPDNLPLERKFMDRLLVPRGRGLRTMTGFYSTKPGFSDNAVRRRTLYRPTVD